MSEETKENKIKITAQDRESYYRITNHKSELLESINQLKKEYDEECKRQGLKDPSYLSKRISKLDRAEKDIGKLREEDIDSLKAEKLPSSELNFIIFLIYLIDPTEIKKEIEEYLNS